MAIITSGCFLSCNDAVSSTQSSAKDTDAIITTIEMIDSIKSSGVLYHLEYWEVGDLGYYKPITMYANKLSTAKDTLYYVSMEKEASSYSSSLSSRYEQAIIDLKEIKSFCAAIDEIKKNLERKTEHNEVYTYCSKSEAMVRCVLYKDGSTPYVNIYVNRRNSDSGMLGNLNGFELDKFNSLLKDAEKKIEEIKKPMKKKNNK